MKKHTVLILLNILFCSSVFAQTSGEKREGGPYAKFGFGYSMITLQPVGEAKSDFSGWHAAAEAGLNFAVNEIWGFNLAAEYKTTDVENTIDSPTYMEKADVTSSAGKLGFYWRNLTIGGGYLSTKIKTKNVSNVSASTTNSFSGNPQLYYVNYGFEKNNLGANIEVQYITGDLDDVKYTDASIGVRLIYLFGK